MRGTGRAAAEERHARRTALAGLAGLAAILALALAGCGGGARQDANEASGTVAMEVVRAQFPATQSIARPTEMEIVVRNPGTHTVPNVAITVDSFLYSEHFAELAANRRPVWAIERGPGKPARTPVQSQEVSIPGGGQTAYVNTWALGPLAPGQTTAFTWLVVPVKAGSHTVRFAVNAGLAGKARAKLANGGPLSGHFTVSIAPAPGLTHVDPATGRVQPGALPLHP